MKRKNLTPSNIIFAIFLVLLIIPQTRTAIQVGMNTIRVQLFSPSILAFEAQTQLEPLTYKLVDLKGSQATAQIGQGKIVFLSYWATWCPPCIAELPSIQMLYDDYSDKIDFILLTNEDPMVVRAFLEKKQYDLPIYIPRMPMPEKLYENSIPTNYIIDGTGKVIIKETGATDWDSEKLRAVLDSL